MRIRRIYIPELIIRLHSFLVNSGDKIAECAVLFFLLSSSVDLPPCRNLKYAMDLVNIVADSRYRLYDDFLGGGEGQRLNDYLLAVRQAVLKGLETGGSDPFRILHV